MMNRIIFTLAISVVGTTYAQNQSAWEQHRGKPGPTGWRCNVIQADPKNHGPDGINLHDWDGDGDLDVFSNAEEGRYSRLYFNPGADKVRDYWNDFIEFKHGKCEDSGIGDLDNDGDIDYIANGGWVFFNPGDDHVRDVQKWTQMILFKNERRVPVVADIDGDGLADLIVGAQEWYKQPALDKHDAANWKRFAIGKNRWPMNCIMVDIDKDGDTDMVVPDRGKEICWYVNPGGENITEPWQRKTIHSHTEPMFMSVVDVNGDEIDDFVIAGGNKGVKAKTLLILLRTNTTGDPQFHEITIDQPSGNFPKGVAVTDTDGDPRKREILVIPKTGDIWTATYSGDSKNAANWKATPVRIPGAATRRKMDNAWPADLDGDGDLDVVTTEENGHWGVIWFENPLKDRSRN
jgi:hypothetical protein